MNDNRKDLPEYIKNLAGKKIGEHEEYEISEDLNSCKHGASAYVLMAKNNMRHKKAIKILRMERENDKEAVKKFKAEIDKLIKIKHPNIISVEKFGKHTVTYAKQTHCLPYYVMEYVDGQQADEWVTKKTRANKFLGVKEVCSFIRQHTIFLKVNSSS